MRHRRRTRKLGFKTAHRQAVLHNMVSSLIQHGRIVTTVPRAKEIRRLADRMVTLAKAGTVHARRQAFDIVRSRDVVMRLFSHWGPQFNGRPGGYTRIVRLGQRRGDAAPVSIVEFATESLEKIKARASRRPMRPEVSASPVVPAALAPAREESPTPPFADATEVVAASENPPGSPEEGSIGASPETLTSEELPPRKDVP